MEPLNLPIQGAVSEQTMQNQLVTSQNTLVSSIRIEGLQNRSYENQMMTLNVEEAVNGATDRDYKIAVLKLHGIAVADKKLLVTKKYIVSVFQTKVTRMYRSRQQKAWLAGKASTKRETFQSVDLNENTRECRRVKTLSIRALYALGLDYGVVKIGIRAGNMVEVQDVIPGPKLNREMEKSFFHALSGYVKSLPHTLVPLDQVVLGADPEFIMRKNNGSLIMASDYFPRFGRVGCDAIWYGQNRSAKPLVEIRPQPTRDPRQLVIRLYKGMLQASKRVNITDVQWLAGALPHPGFPLGGHIHFSGVYLNFKLLRALDHYLALPLVLVEDPIGVRRRPRYGYLGDYRNQFHGGFEYRTLPSWLVSPTLTKGVLALAKLVVARYPILKADDLKRYTVQKAYYDGNKEQLKPIVSRLWEELKGLDDYQRYQRYLDSFFRMLFSDKTWNESKDIRKLWKIPPYR